MAAAAKPSLFKIFFGLTENVSLRASRVSEACRVLGAASSRRARVARDVAVARVRPDRPPRAPPTRRTLLLVAPHVMRRGVAAVLGLRWGPADVGPAAARFRPLVRLAGRVPLLTPARHPLPPTPAPQIPLYAMTGLACCLAAYTPVRHLVMSDALPTPSTSDAAPMPVRAPPQKPAMRTPCEPPDLSPATCPAPPPQMTAPDIALGRGARDVEAYLGSHPPTLERAKHYGAHAHGVAMSAARRRV